MLKMACVFWGILILHMMVYTSYAQASRADSVKVVSIKVIATARTDNVDTSEAPSKENAATVVEEVNPIINSPAPKERATTWRSKPNQNLAHSEALPKSDTKLSQPRRSEPQEKQFVDEKPTSKQGNSKYFLASFLLIITGILVLLFFRSGLPLIAAILMMVAGYYILIYSLLFMAP